MSNCYQTFLSPHSEAANAAIDFIWTTAKAQLDSKIVATWQKGPRVIDFCFMAEENGNSQIIMYEDGVPKSTKSSESLNWTEIGQLLDACKKYGHVY